MDSSGATFTFGLDLVTLPKTPALADLVLAFKNLSSCAGAALPPAIRDRLAGYCPEIVDSPASWWYALMFYISGQTVGHQGKRGFVYDRELVIPRPLLCSVDAIQRLGLNTDSPGFPEVRASDNTEVSPTKPRGTEQVTREEYRQLREVKRRIDPNDDYVGLSVAILRVFERIAEVNTPPLNDWPVLILGPSGAGKTEIARLIHKSSARKHKGFREEQASTLRAADWAVVHARWAGHGRDSGLKDVPPKGTEGILQECDGGTIFIDEIAEISKDAQDFLLLVLDKKPISKPSGSAPQITPDVRLVFATNRDLGRLATEGAFRHDLLLRIHANTIHIPPLKDRKEDIPLFVDKWCEGHERALGFLLALLRHDWPDEVRGLKAAIDRAMAKATLTGSLLSADLLELPTAAAVNEMNENTVEEETYRFLRETLEGQGLEMKKGLHKRIAEILNCSAAKISGIAGRIQDQTPS